MATDNDCVQYWTHMKDRAAMHISTVTERTDPETEAALGFLRKVVGTMPTTGHKFLGGLMVASSLGRIEGFLGSMADADGCIDTDVVRKMVSEGFASSGDKVTFTIGDDSVRWLVKPVNVSVSKSDFDEMLAGLEARYR